MMRKLIVANWKMNGSGEKLKSDLIHYVNNQYSNKNNVILALPSIYLGLAHYILSNCSKKGNKLSLKLASQDISRFSGYGAYTGEVSGVMLKDIGVRYIIIGHSERRNIVEEREDILLLKLENTLNSGLTPIFCIGEPYSIRANNQYHDFLLDQLSLLIKIKNAFTDMIVAYEPIWSIGTGVVPEYNQIQEIMELIEAFMQKNLPHAKITTLYGGSVSGKNADMVLSLNAVGGVLVGGASLNVDDFIKICQAS